MTSELTPASSGLAASPKSAPTRAFCSFRVDERLYGIEVSRLREISTNTSITPVPPAPAVVRGLANLRSRILLVLDVRPLLGLAPIAITSESRLIILNPGVAEDIGLLVDRGGDIVSVSSDAIEPVSDVDPSRGDDRPLVAEVCKLAKELMMVIDATRLAQTVAKLIG